MKNVGIFFLILSLFTASRCKKTATSIESLPPITQEGRNTLGFMMNGVAWTPKGISGLSPNLSADVDFGISSGIFNITAYRVENGVRQQFSVGIADSLNYYSVPKTFFISQNTNGAFYFYKPPCVTITRDSNTYSAGYLQLFMLDKVNRIIAGTFSVTMCLKGCDTIRITDGRFDLKY